MTRLLMILYSLAAVGALVIWSAAFVVSETEQVIVTQFGEPVGEPITEAGLYWKTPFVQEVHRFEKRLLAFDGAPDEIPTKDKKYIHIDTFARWRIKDPLQFFRAVNNEAGAQTRLDDIIDGATRDVVSNNRLLEAVRNSNRELALIEGVGPEQEAAGQVAANVPAPDLGDVRGIEEVSPIERGRDAITREIFEASKDKVGEYGIELVDVRIKRINYVSQVEKQVFTRMISERQQIAEKYRAEGKQFRLGFAGKIEREKNRLLSEAYAKAERIKAEGDAEAARIYAEAYGHDPEFYRFWRTLEMYRRNLSRNTTLVLGTDSDLFRYFVDAGLVKHSSD